MDETPASWLQKSFPASDSLPDYLSNLNERVSYMKEVIAQPDHMLLRKHRVTIWLPGLYDQANFFTVILQQDARSREYAMHSLGLQFTVTPFTCDHEPTRPKEETASVSDLDTDNNRHRMISLLREKVPMLRKTAGTSYFIYGLKIEGARWNTRMKRLEDIPICRSSKMSYALPAI